MTEVRIDTITYPIRLGQFLKLIEVVPDGFAAKLLIQGGEIRVNGIIEQRRGRQLHRDDTVELADGSKYELR